MYKQAIVVRKDLKWGKGKLVIHALHAAIGSMRKVDESLIRKWEAEGAKKVLLKVASEKEIKELQKKSNQEKIPNFLVADAGLTQLKKGTVTALALGPDQEKKIDRVTGKLKLL